MPWSVWFGGGQVCLVLVMVDHVRLMLVTTGCVRLVYLSGIFALLILAKVVVGIGIGIF